MHFLHYFSYTNVLQISPKLRLYVLLKSFQLWLYYAANHIWFFSLKCWIYPFTNNAKNLSCVPCNSIYYWNLISILHNNFQYKTFQTSYWLKDQFRAHDKVLPCRVLQNSCGWIINHVLDSEEPEDRFDSFMNYNLLILKMFDNRDCPWPWLAVGDVPHHGQAHAKLVTPCQVRNVNFWTSSFLFSPLIL